MFLPRWPARESPSAGEGNCTGLVAVCIDKDKGSPHAIKWAVQNLLQRGQTVILLHVKVKSSSHYLPSIPRNNGSDGRSENGEKQVDLQTKLLLLPFICFCTRNNIKCRSVILEDPDVANAIAEYVGLAAIEHLVVGASSRYGFLRFKEKDMPGAISKATPDFSNVYVISKGKVQSTRSASGSAPAVPVIQHQVNNKQNITRSDPSGRLLPPQTPARDRSMMEPRLSVDDEMSFRHILHQFLDGFLPRWPARESLSAGKGNGLGLVAVCIDKDKGSQHAVKWAVENLLQRGQTVILLHAKIKSSSHYLPSIPRNYGSDGRSENGGKQVDLQTKELLLRFRCFCTRNNIQCRDVILEDPDIANAIAEYVGLVAIEHLVVGASSRSGFLRFKEKDTPEALRKATPDFCNVYVISKGKVQSTRSACRSVPPVPLIQRGVNWV